MKGTEKQIIYANKIIEKTINTMTKVIELNSKNIEIQTRLEEKLSDYNLLVSKIENASHIISYFNIEQHNILNALILEPLENKSYYEKMGWNKEQIADRYAEFIKQNMSTYCCNELKIRDFENILFDEYIEFKKTNR